jgi:hypothetical protein
MDDEERAEYQRQQQQRRERDRHRLFFNPAAQQNQEFSRTFGLPDLRVRVDVRPTEECVFAMYSDRTVLGRVGFTVVAPDSLQLTGRLQLALQAIATGLRDPEFREIESRDFRDVERSWDRERFTDQNDNPQRTQFYNLIAEWRALNQMYGTLQAVLTELRNYYSDYSNQIRRATNEAQHYNEPQTAFSLSLTADGVPDDIMTSATRAAAPPPRKRRKLRGGN